MEVEQHQEEVPAIDEGPQEQMATDHHEHKQENNEIVGAICLEGAGKSPELFAQIPVTLDIENPAVNIAIGQQSAVPEAVDPTVEAIPSTVAQDVDLPLGPIQLINLHDCDQDIDYPMLHSLDDMSMLDAGTSVNGSDRQMQAYAKLEFADGQFYMNTWSVELGRDLRAAKKALEQKYLEDKLSEFSMRQYSNSITGEQGYVAISDALSGAPDSFSEAGGTSIINNDNSRTLKKPRRKVKSEGSLSRKLSRHGSIIDLDTKPRIIDPANLVLDPTSRVQIENQQFVLPPADECPLIPISGSKDGCSAISRKHAKIQYNFNKRLFELEVKGRNGVFIDDIHYGPGEFAELRSRCHIQIGGVSIRFILPNVADGETGAETALHSDAMSFDFEDGRGESVAAADVTNTSSASSQGSEDELQHLSAEMIGESSEEDGDDEEDEDSTMISTAQKASAKPTASNKQSGRSPSKIKLKVKAKDSMKELLVKRSGSPRKAQSPPAKIDQETLKKAGIDIPIDMMPPQRTGPGRPPKNGIMSKREENSIKKKIKELAKAQAIADGTLPPDTSLSPTDGEKRRYIKKEGSKDIHESIEGNDGPLLKTAKEKKPPKPPRSPSPFVDPETLTAEQLAKPAQSYLVILQEVLGKSPTGQMSLPQIYKAVERKYPYFKFKVSTPGWQSSIRHNLGQNGCFKKTETREGKGFMWCLDPNAPPEKEKDKRARRTSPAATTQQPYLQAGSQMYRPAFTAQSNSVPGQLQGPGVAVNHTFTTQRLPNGISASGTIGPTNGTYISQYNVAARNTQSHQPSQTGQIGLAQTNAGPQGIGAPVSYAARPPPTRFTGQNGVNMQTGALLQGAPIQMNDLPTYARDAINTYKESLLKSLKMPRKELIINTVIDKVLGKPFVPFTDSSEKHALISLAGPLAELLKNMMSRLGAPQVNQQATRPHPTPPSGPRPSIANNTASSTNQSPAATASHHGQTSGLSTSLSQASLPVQINSATPNLPSVEGASPSAAPATATATQPRAASALNQTAVQSTYSPSASASIPANVQAQPRQSNQTQQGMPTTTPSQASRTATPVASPITPVHVSSPSLPAATVVPGSNDGSAQTKQLATEDSSSKDSAIATEQKRFLSVLEQLPPANSAVAGSGSGGHNSTANDMRGIKRPLEQSNSPITQLKESRITSTAGINGQDGDGPPTKKQAL